MFDPSAIAKMTTREACVAADASDPLATFRSEFLLPPGELYLDGNSLGARPLGAAERAQDVVLREWGTDLIRSWNTNNWFELPVRIGEKLGTLLGGGTGTTVATDTTSINIFKALAAALRIQEEDAPGRRVILSERDNFPTDLYMIQGLAEFLDRGYEVRLIDDALSLDEALTDEVAVVLLSHVNYRTGALWPMTNVTQRAHDAGALIIWDLCHSAGAVPVTLTASGADFAVGCTYKYLNGGPGSPAFIWVAAQHQDRFQQPLSGWWGHARPFAMSPEYAPADGIRKFLCGTQPIVSLAVSEVGIDIALRVDQELLRAKSLTMTELFISLVEQRLADHPLTLITPRDPEARGSHVSLRHPDGYAVMQALIARGVIGDYREPEVLRFGFTPLYLSYADVWDAVEVLREVLDEKLWDTPEFHRRGAVT